MDVQPFRDSHTYKMAKLENARVALINGFSHDTPYTTDFTESHTNFAECLAACVPAIVGNSNGTTIPTTSASTSFAFFSQAMK